MLIKDMVEYIGVASVILVSGKKLVSE